MAHNLKPRITGKNYRIGRDEFKKRFFKEFCDPHFHPLSSELEKIFNIAWENYQEGRKAPSVRKAGPGFKNPDYELSQDWLEAKIAINEAQDFYDSPDSPSTCLLIVASDRNEGTCPGEISKSSRLASLAQKTLEAQGIKVELLDLSLMTVEYGKMIYPCKGCVSTAMPLCHWPCSCYPNHSLGQSHDWMNEIYPMWVRAHGVMIVTPVYWHQAPSVLKLMMDRLVCADGGNQDPTSTKGKKAELAKEMELQGWSYPRHLEGRLYSVIVHGDVVGVNELKTALSEWLEEMMLIPAGLGSSLGRYIGYYESYAESHVALDEDIKIQAEVRNAALALAYSIKAKRNGELSSLLPPIEDPRPK